MADNIQFRRDLAANWRTYNTLLPIGSPGFETDTRLFKIGDGTTTWNTLPYANLPDTTLAGGRLSIYQGLPVALPNPGFFNPTPPTILYYVPYTSNLITLWTPGVGWRTRSFDTTTAVSLIGRPANTNYDVFASDVNGSVQLSLVAWVDDWTRTALPGCSSAGIIQHQGVMVQCGNAANRYLGTVRTSAAGGSTQDNFWRRFVYNYSNQVMTTTYWYHSIPHTYSAGYWRRWDSGGYGDAVQQAQGVNKLQVVLGAPTTIFMKTFAYTRYGNTAPMIYGYATQRANPALWNNVAPDGDFTGYPDQTVNAIDPVPLGGQSIMTQNTASTIGRNTVGLVEFWMAQFGYTSNSWFYSAAINADILM